MGDQDKFLEGSVLGRWWNRAWTGEPALAAPPPAPPPSPLKEAEVCRDAAEELVAIAAVVPRRPPATSKPIDIPTRKPAAVRPVFESVPEDKRYWCILGLALNTFSVRTTRNRECLIVLWNPQQVFDMERQFAPKSFLLSSLHNTDICKEAVRTCEIKAKWPRTHQLADHGILE